MDEEGYKTSTTADSNKDWTFSYKLAEHDVSTPKILHEKLMRDDGVIFISIDDNELDNLIKLCREIFGKDNYINLISIKAKDSSGASGGGEDRRLKKNIEYLVSFSKSDSFKKFNDIYKIESLSKYIRDRKEAGKGFCLYKSIN